MPTIYEISERFNESRERLYDNLLAHLNRRDSVLETYWAAARAEEYTLTDGRHIQQIWGITNAHYGIASGEESRFLHFIVKAVATSATGTEIQVMVITPFPLFEAIQLTRGDELNIASAGALEGQRLAKIADKVLEFCANPYADTDTGMVGWFRKLLVQNKAKRKL